MPKRSDAAIAEAQRATREVYRELEQRPFDRNCVNRTECCQFKLTGRTPMLTKGEALVAAAGLRATGRRELPQSADEAAGRCPFLDSVGRCLIYAARPFGCRTHFCPAAGGPALRKEVLDLIRKLEAIDATLGGDGPHAIHGAVEAALETIENEGRGRPRRS